MTINKSIYNKKYIACHTIKDGAIIVGAGNTYSEAITACTARVIRIVDTSAQDLQIEGARRFHAFTK